MEKRIRLGIVGVGRGQTFAAMAQHIGMELVALCDKREDALNELNKQYGVTAYTDYDTFLEHDMDAVILCNYFHEHAPLAIKAMDAGKHVMSECLACKTLGEGVELARAVERTGKIYMFAENYAYFNYIQEMRRLYEAGEIGEVQYAEGEYIHPIDDWTYSVLSPGMNHWRNHLPPTYYPTHAMSPIMFVTGVRPVSVNALSIPASPQEQQTLHVRRGDPAAIMLCRMNNGAVVRLAGLFLRGHGNWYRIHGTRGLMENMRTGNRDELRIAHEPWDMKEGDEGEKIYLPEFPVHDELAKSAGHGGGDFFTSYYFAEAIRKNEQPYLDVYKGIDMTLVGIQSWRSCLSGGAPVEIPDFKNEEIRKQYENDDWSPFPEDRKPGQPFSSITGEITPSKEAIAYAKNVWKESGYEVD